MNDGCEYSPWMAPAAPLIQGLTASLGRRGPINTSSPWPGPTTVIASALDRALHSWWPDWELAGGQGSLMAHSRGVGPGGSVLGDRMHRGRKVMPAVLVFHTVGCAGPVGC